MLVKQMRKYVGGVRLSLTLLAMLFGFLVVFIDLIFKLGLSKAAYVYMTGVLATIAVFVYTDTVRPAKMSEEAEPESAPAPAAETLSPAAEAKV